MIIKCFGSSSAGNCYIVSDGTNDLMIEAGLELKTIKKLYDKPVSLLDGVLTTHRHGDHIEAVKGLLKASCNVFMTNDTKEHLKIDNLRAQIVQNGYNYSVGSYKFHVFDVFHDVPAVGYLIYSKITKERLLFINDTKHFNKTYKDVDCIMIECNYDREIMDYNVENDLLDPYAAKRIKKSHFEINNVIKYLKSCDLKALKQIVLMHLSNGNSNADDFKQRVQEATGVPTVVAEKGTVIEWL